MKLVEKELNEQKLRGGYYTPPKIAEFLCNWAITKNTKKILEPSCGDGNFVEEIILTLKKLNFNKCEIEHMIKGVELIKEEANKSEKRAKELSIESSIIINSDFFHYTDSHKTDKYDVVLGNPPFIRYQNFPEKHRDLAISMMKDLGLNPNKLTNIWVPFLVISASLLTPDGKLGMVIPAELFQVKYAAETRVFLSNFFERITIITFKKLVFTNIQQEVVLLLCEKKSDESKGVRVIECEKLNDLSSIDFKKINNSELKSIDHSTDKWTKYFLSEYEINLLNSLKSDKRIISCSDILEVDVGIVTGRNEFFMMTQEQVIKWNLENYTVPVVSKSNQLKGMFFSEKDFEENANNNQVVYLFLPPDVDFEYLPQECQKYITYGESQSFHTGYKCRIRKRWYINRSLWSPDGFALRQVGDYPKLVLNNTSASSTDTVHRVRFKENVNTQLATISFLNSLSFAFSEITGRSYGGGVMTFEPTEIEEIKMPALENISINLERIEKLIRVRDIEEVLDIIDNELLIKIHKFSNEEVNTLRSIWKKLSERRNGRK